MFCDVSAWWFIPLSKWVLTPVISGLIAPTYPIYNQGRNPLAIRGMSHQVACIEVFVHLTCIDPRTILPTAQRFVSKFARGPRESRQGPSSSNMLLQPNR